ncbi:MAG: hypothetical protein GKC53_00455 [Neisseriaceae bacterium]|nr:MAG: hypothetical protein GKC53_00455 [Neisseriaceae bacterium]
MKSKQLNELENLIESMINKINDLRVENRVLKRQTMENQENNAKIFQIQEQNIALLTESNKILQLKINMLKQELKLLKGSINE